MTSLASATAAIDACVAVCSGPSDYRSATAISDVVRRAIAALQLPENLIRTGDRVVLKPNWVKEHDERRPGPGQWEHVVTHPTVIEAVLRWAAPQLGGSGSITICDAPQTDSSFGALRAYCRLDDLVERCRRDFPGVDVRVLDLRPEEWKAIDGVTVARTPLPGDPLGATHVRLDAASAFVDFRGQGRLYGASYDMAETNARHHGSRHEYLLCRTPMDADVLINLPKLKTHKKVGLTCALKNLVGINANKNWLPHHTEGTPELGGDQFPVSTAKTRLEHVLMGRAKRWLKGRPTLSRLFVPVKAAGRRVFGDTQRVVRSGNWHGNDTCWRMVLDLNKCLFWFDGQGVRRSATVALSCRRRRHRRRRGQRADGSRSPSRGRRAGGNSPRRRRRGGGDADGVRLDSPAHAPELLRRRRSPAVHVRARRHRGAVGPPGVAGPRRGAPGPSPLSTAFWLGRSDRERQARPTSRRMSLEDSLYPLLSLYDRLPPFVRSAVAAGYRRLPQDWTIGARYAEFAALAREGEGWTAEAAWSYQRDQLRRTLVHAGTHCPYYRRAFADAGFRPEALETPSDLRACPMLDKQTLLESRHELLSTQFNARTRLYLTTGGSTGVPVGFYLHKGISRPKERAFLEASWQRGGFSSGARLAVIRGQVTSSTAGGRIVSYDGTRDWLMLSSYHLTAARLPEYLQALERFRPDLLHAYPSAALQLADHLVRSGRPWRLQLRGLLCGSERLTLPQKRLLEETFRCRVYRWYGHSERVVLAGEGRRSELFYFWPQYGFVEFGPPDAGGLQEVIGTSFHNLVMPLVRYRTGDYVRVAPRTGAAEFPWPAVSEVAGREQEYLVSASGRQISLTAINMHSDIFDDLYALQFYQEQPGVAELRYVAGPRFHTSRLAAIEAALLQKLGDDFRLVLRAVQETEKTARGKQRWLVSRLAEPSPDERGCEGTASAR